MVRSVEVDMPTEVRRALDEARLMPAFEARPPHQRRGYLLWITDARARGTRYKRTAQMIAELDEGGVYRNEPHGPSAKYSVASPYRSTTSKSSQVVTS
jgi:uncharacterized protein YdeI (YjbR/CyaY-like superfamily)